MLHCCSRLTAIPLLGLALLVGVTPGAAQAGPYLSSTSPADPACSGYQWVGVKKDRFKPCPSEGAWKGQALFASFYRALSCGERSRAERAGLDRFCVYRAPYDPVAFDPAQLEPPPALRARLAKLDKDCVGLQPQQATTEDLHGLLSSTLEQEFRRQAGGLSVPLRAGAGVRLAVLDTQPTGKGVPLTSGVSPHGYGLAHMARRLACPGVGPNQPCGLELTTRLALPILDFDKRGDTLEPVAGDSMTQGGRYGRLTDVALAVADEVKATSELPGPPRRLVLNLSLGWDGALFGGVETSPKEMPAAVEAAWSALEYAQLSGALVVAAAGNRLAGVGSPCGALFPAAWERLGPAVTSPRAFAVGAVQANGEPLANSRTCARPARQAYGDHAVVFATGERPTTSLTGSSVAALVVATAAAAAWAERPSLSPAQVLALLEESGDRLVTATADESVESQRISVCAAHCLAVGPSGACAPSDCPRWPHAPRPLSASLTAFRADWLLRVARVETERLEVPSCAMRSCAGSGPDPHSPIPVRPQPEEDPCLNCALTGGGPRLSNTVLAANGPALESSADDGLCRVLVQLREAWFDLHGGTCLEAPRLVVERTDPAGVERSTHWLAAETTAGSGLHYCAGTQDATHSLEIDLGVPCSSFAGATVRLELDAVTYPGGDLIRTVEASVLVKP